GRAQPTPAKSGWRDPPPGLDELFAPWEQAFQRYRVPPVGSASAAIDPSVVDELRRASQVQARALAATSVHAEVDSIVAAMSVGRGGARTRNVPAVAPAAPVRAAAPAGAPMAKPSPAGMALQALKLSAKAGAPRRESDGFFGNAGGDDEGGPMMEEEQASLGEAPNEPLPELALGEALLDYDRLRI